MDDAYLYRQIADTIRQQILTGHYKPGDRLPSVRQLCSAWGCTPGTIQRAYRALAREGLLVSRAGQGTQVAGMVPQGKAQAQGALRRASLVNRLENTLLEALTAGYELNEIQQAMDLAMDRWRALSASASSPPVETLRFAGSHDMLVNELGRHFFGHVAQGVSLQLTYSGSLAGLIALVEGSADLAGCHLWDAETASYNLPFVRRLLPGKDVTVVTLAHRRIGLMTAPGNPRSLTGLPDLAQPGLRFVNRQSGSGTRVWLDTQLAGLGIDPRQVRGYDDERLTHSDVARAVAEGVADAGLGAESAALAYGLNFIFLTQERYDLVMLTETSHHPALRHLIEWMASPAGRQFIDQHRGYDSGESGNFQPVNR